MLTKVILDGPMGKQFGREWNLEVNSPSEALHLIDVNSPGLLAWCKKAVGKYVGYKVKCTYENGKSELLNDDNYLLNRKVKSIRFTPVVTGAGSTGKMIVGALMIIGSFYAGPVFGPYMFQMGVGLALSGAVEALSPQPKSPNAASSAQGRSLSSNYFSGPVNTTEQGIPVQLIYGRVLVGSHVISAAMDVDQIVV